MGTVMWQFNPRYSQRRRFSDSMALFLWLLASPLCVRSLPRKKRLNPTLWRLFCCARASPLVVLTCRAYVPSCSTTYRQRVVLRNTFVGWAVRLAQVVEVKHGRSSRLARRNGLNGYKHAWPVKAPKAERATLKPWLWKRFCKPASGGRERSMKSARLRSSLHSSGGV